MSEESAFDTMAKLFHGILFAYQKSIGSSTSKEASIVFDEKVIPFLDAAFEDDPFMEILDEDSNSSLDSSKNYLEKSGLVKEVVVKHKFRGFTVEINDCLFAKEVHDHLDTEDVMCPYGMIAHYMRAQATGRNTRKSLSKFRETSSLTHIDIV